MKVLALAGDIGSQMADIRLITPLRAWPQAFSGQLAQRSFRDCSRADLRVADVLVVQRANTHRIWQLQQAMRLVGGTVVYEIDDLLTNISPHISSQASVVARHGLLLRCLDESDLVTPDDATTPLVHNDEASWQTALWRAITDTAWRQQIAASAQQQVKAKHQLELTAKAWNVALNCAIQRRSEAALPSPGWLRRGQQWWASACDLALIDARRWNRSQLNALKQRDQ